MLSGMWGQGRDGSASLKGCVWDSVWGHMCLPGCKSLQQWLSMYVHTCVPLWGVHSGPSLFCVSSCECVWFCTCSLWCVTVLYLCMCVYDCVPVSVCFIYFEKYLCEYMNLWMCYLGMWLNEKYLLCVPKYLLCGWDDIFTDVFVSIHQLYFSVSSCVLYVQILLRTSWVNIHTDYWCLKQK